jgi:hypothetical protein
MLFQAGMSLMEVMLGGAVLAGVGLAGAYIVKQQREAQYRVEQDRELNLFHDRLSRIMNAPANCREFMREITAQLGGGMTFSSERVSTASNPIQLHTCAGTCNASDTIGTAPTEKGPAVIRPGDWTDNKRNWRMVAFNIPDLQFSGINAASGRYAFKIEYNNPRYRSIHKDLILNLRFENGRFVQCMDPQSSSVNNMQNDICRGMINSLGVNSLGSIVEWDPLTQRCQPRPSIVRVCTDLGLVFAGIDSNGMARCKGTPEIVNPSPLAPATGTATCTNVGMRWDAVAKKLVPECR